MHHIRTTVCRCLLAGILGAVAAWAQDLHGSIVGGGYQVVGLDLSCDFVAVAGGSGHTVALKADGSIAVWGRNDYGQCRIPSPNTGFVAVAAGEEHSLGLKADGSIVSWGRNKYG